LEEVIDMSRLKVHLFGKFLAELNGRRLEGLDGPKLQELFAYLLIYKGKSHDREELAGLLWGDADTAQSKKYLRQALWHLSSALNSEDDLSIGRVLVVGQDRVDVDCKADLWIDIAEFENAFTSVKGVPGHEMDLHTTSTLKAAAELYRGDLLEGCYHDWCLFERERLQSAYIIILDKLMDYCEASSQFESGIVYGNRILGIDRARERTHRRLMRLHYMSGDRTASLRQYKRCADALLEELSVKPAKKTVELYEQIRCDQLCGPSHAQNGLATGPESASQNTIGLLGELRKSLKDFQARIKQEIETIDAVLRDRR
jgi:DNA-binding SARP family transcriptional activator